MKRSHTAVVLVLLLVVAACARTSELDNMAPGTSVAVTMRDGSVTNGRLVQVKADEVLVAPDGGGEWKSLPRAQVTKVEPRPIDAPRDASDGAARTPSPVPTAAPDRASQPAPRAEEPAPREVVVPTGTAFDARLENSLASNASHVNEPVTATLAAPVVVEGVEVVPAGSTMAGVVTAVKPSGKVKGRAELAFRFTSLKAPDGTEYAIRTDVIAQQARSTTKEDALKIGAPAAGGAIIGGLLGGKKGAAIGGAVGGGAGTAVVLSTAGEEVRLAAGAHVNVRLREPLPVRVSGRR